MPSHFGNVIYVPSPLTVTAPEVIVGGSASHPPPHPPSADVARSMLMRFQLLGGAANTNCGNWSDMGLSVVDS